MLLLAGCPWIDADELSQRLDGDGDGVEGIDVGGTDCDDGDASVFPGAPERCNGRDDDCDGTIDDLGDDHEGDDGTLYYADRDGDGYGDDAAITWSCTLLADHVTRGGDCDDDDPARTPELTWFPDADGDGEGDESAPAVTACEAPSGHVATAEDCDDTDPSVQPGADERCDDVDSDCDDDLDDPDVVDPGTWYADTDGDQHGDAEVSQVACDPGPGWVPSSDDCDDDAAGTYPGADDPCYDGIDADCGGDDDLDCDGDGFAGFEGGGDDCADDDPLVYPGVITTRRVPADYPTIQAALDAACPDDVVQVAEGIHSGGVVAARPVELRGAGRARTFLTGEDDERVLLLEQGGLVEGLSLQFGEVDGDGACLHAATERPVTLIDVDMLPCVATGRGGGLFVDGALLTMERVDIQVASADEGGGAYLTGLQAGSRLDTVELQITSATTRGGGLVIADSEVDITDLRLVDTAASDGGGLYVDTVAGAWAGLRIERPTGGLHSGIHLVGAGSPTPLVGTDWAIEEPDGGYLSTGLYADDTDDFTLSGLVIAGGSSSTPDPQSLFADVRGTAELEHVQLLRPWGGVTLLAPLKGSVRLAHATIVEPQGGVVISGSSPSNAIVSHVSITGAVGTGLTVGGNGTVQWCNAYGSSVADYSDPTQLGINGNLSVPPGLLSVGPSLPASMLDVRLRSDSLLRDAGASGLTDPDGTRADIGAYGGPGAQADVYDDLDGDGMYDSWERTHGLDPTRDDSAQDPDVDGLDNLGEHDAGTWPLTADTDADGALDGDELSGGTDPLDAGSL